MNPQAPSPLISFVPILVIFAIFYFLIIRPQQKQVKDHEAMLAGLKKGDRVLTTGGLYATILGFKGDDIELRLADNMKVLAARGSVSKVVNAETGVGAANSPVSA